MLRRHYICYGLLFQSKAIKISKPVQVKVNDLFLKKYNIIIIKSIIISSNPQQNYCLKNDFALQKCTQ